jgi:acyl-coenzyme A thioesterase PaaI-like protein
MKKLSIEQQTLLLNCINKNTLFYGNHKIKSKISNESMIDELCAHEIYDWIVSIYWGESLGIRFALKMEELTGDIRWNEVLKDEIDHQKRIADWLLESGLTIKNPNPLLKRGIRILSQIESKKTMFEMIEIIQWGQLFLEELGTIMGKWRLGSIEDRGLKSILYKIFKDERKHIAMGKKIISDLEIKTISDFEMMRSKSFTIFPIQIAKKILPQNLFLEVKKISNEVVIDVIAEIEKINSIYRPVDIIKKWEKSRGYHCFACCPTRSEGLLLEPKISKDNYVYDELSFSKRFEGFNGIIHGGFVAMMLDEIMCYAPILLENQLIVTKNLNINYILPLRTSKVYRIKSSIEKKSLPLYEVIGLIEDITTGEVLAKATSTLFAPNLKIAQKLFPEILEHDDFKEMILK